MFPSHGIWTLGGGDGGSWAAAGRSESAPRVSLFLRLLDWVRASSQEGQPHHPPSILSTRVSPSFWWEVIIVIYSLSFPRDDLSLHFVRAALAVSCMALKDIWKCLDSLWSSGSSTMERLGRVGLAQFSGPAASGMARALRFSECSSFFSSQTHTLLLPFPSISSHPTLEGSACLHIL